jgi:hypothetical protein
VTNPIENTSGSAPQKPNGITISRRMLIVGATVLLVILVTAGIMIGYAAGVGSTSNAGNSNEDPSAASQTATAIATPLPRQPTPTPTPTLNPYGFGETFTTGNVTLTVNSIEAVDSISTTQGSPITPDAGGQLFLLKMAYSNSKTQADLSCGNTDLYLQAFDTLEREMAPVFELSRIPGNPGCNDHLLQNTQHEWNYVFQSVAGASPLALSVTETDKYLDPVWVDLQQ